MSVLIHYFTLAAVMFMGAEAVLMFQKLIVVYGQTSTKFFVAVTLICWCECITVCRLHYTSLGNYDLAEVLVTGCVRYRDVLILDHKVYFPLALPPVVPIIPVVIPMAVDLSDTVSRDLVVRMPTEENRGL